jgi:hypothetical protein
VWLDGRSPSFVFLDTSSPLTIFTGSLPFSLCVVVGGLMYRVERNKKHCGVIACCQSHWLMNVGV